MSVLIIAEAGVNHNGDLQTALELVDAAKAAGADVVKFQTFNAEELVTKDAVKAEYQKEDTTLSETQFEMLKKLELTKDMHRTLHKYCNDKKIEFLSTGFDIASIDFLNNLGMNFFKIPSGEITNLPYLRHIGNMNKPLILSTGMATLDEVLAALNILEEAGTVKNSITVLHCTSAYPAPISDVNLRAMISIREKFGVNVGYSDHTIGIEVAVAAVALGAKIIEKHLTLDKNMVGPDHRASLEPVEFESMVKAIRNIEKALGNGAKAPAPSEIPNIEISRKSIVASENINQGDKFTSANLTTKRPGSGISPMKWDHIIGRRANRNYVSNELIIDES
jgi:N,N'-diacetyllegionaminate synthase